MVTTQGRLWAALALAVLFTASAVAEDRARGGRVDIHPFVGTEIDVRERGTYQLFSDVQDFVRAYVSRAPDGRLFLYVFGKSSVRRATEITESDLRDLRDRIGAAAAAREDAARKIAEARAAAKSRGARGRDPAADPRSNAGISCRASGAAIGLAVGATLGLVAGNIANARDTWTEEWEDTHSGTDWYGNPYSYTETHTLDHYTYPHPEAPFIGAAVGAAFGLTLGTLIGSGADRTYTAAVPQEIRERQIDIGPTALSVAAALAGGALAGTAVEAALYAPENEDEDVDADPPPSTFALASVAVLDGIGIRGLRQRSAHWKAWEDALVAETLAKSGQSSAGTPPPAEPTPAESRPPVDAPPPVGRDVKPIARVVRAELGAERRVADWTGVEPVMAVSAAAASMASGSTLAAVFVAATDRDLFVRLDFGKELPTVPTMYRLTVRQPSGQEIYLVAAFGGSGEWWALANDGTQTILHGMIVARPGSVEMSFALTDLSAHLQAGQVLEVSATVGSSSQSATLSEPLMSALVRF